MVRVKLECKDVFKIPRKRLFELKKNLYLIQFKVESRSDRGDDGGNSGDQDNEDDQCMEELDQDMDPEVEKPTEKKSGGESSTRVSGSGSTPAGSRSVLDWASLFQNEEETKMLETSEIVQYSCTRLLREMEAAYSDLDDDEVNMVNVSDDEMVRMPDELLERLTDQEKVLGLPDNLYMILENTQDITQGVEGKVKLARGKNQKEGRGIWGPTLVEKRPCRQPRDGRTMLEKAQDRKRTNLEEMKGKSNTNNSFAPLAVDDILSVADEIGVNLGNCQSEVEQSLEIIQSGEAMRNSMFVEGCILCQVDKGNTAQPEGIIGQNVDEVLMTPPAQVVHNQVGDSGDGPGQWTCVVNRKKKNQKSSLTMKGLIWNIRGLNEPSRKLCLEKLIREQKVDFVGVQETKKEDFTSSFLKNLSCPTCFVWHFLPAKKQREVYC
jgi:hypothetical protein